MTVDVPHTAAHNRRVMFGDGKTGGPSGLPESAGSVLQTREPAARPETPAERDARRTEYLAPWAAYWHALKESGRWT